MKGPQPTSVESLAATKQHLLTGGGVLSLDPANLAALAERELAGRGGVVGRSLVDVLVELVITRLSTTFLCLAAPDIDDGRPRRDQVMCVSRERGTRQNYHRRHD